MVSISEKSEDCAFIKRKKKSILRKYSPTRSKSIEEANFLAAYLLSLSRNKEAESLLESYAPALTLDEHRPQRWDASCLAKALLAFVCLDGNRREKADDLCCQILGPEYPLSFELSHEVMWDYVKGWSAQLELDETLESSMNDRCIGYAERLLVLIFYEVLMPRTVGLRDPDALMLRSYIQDILSRLKAALSGNGA